MPMIMVWCGEVGFQSGGCIFIEGGSVACMSNHLLRPAMLFLISKRRGVKW